MEINKLRTFVEVATTSSFSDAATKLFINQSSVSKQIKSLEKEINCQLFTRANRQVTLTKYGKMLLPVAQKMLKLNNQFLSDLKKYQQAQEKKITIGVLPSFWDYSYLR